MSDAGYQPEPFQVTMEPTDFGNYRVEIAQDLCWAVFFVNEACYEALGSEDKYWLFKYEEDGHETVTPLERLLTMIRTGKHPDKLKKGEREGHEAWLYDQGKPIVAAWREAHARAKHFCEHPGELRDALRDTVIARWKDEKVVSRQIQLRGFIPKKDRAIMGLKENPKPRLSEGGWQPKRV